MSIMANVAIVVCTKDRPNFVMGFIEHLNRITSCPAIVCFVDSSDDSGTENVVMAAQHSISGVSLIYIHARPGAPNQKNVGLEYLENQAQYEQLAFVSFLDDDIRPNSDYFTHLVKLFEENREVCCLGGFDLSLKPAKNSLLRRLFFLSDSSPGGKILPSGICTTIVPNQRLEQVQWVPGGMQSYRMAAIRSLRFDGRVRIYGDEVEFQTRLPDQNCIFTSNLLGVVHLGATLNKDKARDEQGYMDGFRWTLATRSIAGVRKWAVLSTTGALAFGSFALFLIGKRTTGFQEFLGHLDFFYRLCKRQEVQQLVKF